MGINYSGSLSIDYNLYNRTGSASVDHFYGPWSDNDTLTNFDWLSNGFFDSDYEKLVGLTVGILKEENNNKYVIEYQLCRDTTKQATDISSYYWKQKGSNIVKSDQFTDSEILTIKNGCDNNGYGLFNASALPLNLRQSDLIPVQYLPSDIIEPDGDLQRSFQRNGLYILKDDVTSVFSYKAGAGIEIKDNKIGIKYGKTDYGKFLKATQNGIFWESLDQMTPFVSTSSILIDERSGEITLNVGGIPQISGIELAKGGVQLYKGATSGYLYYDKQKGMFDYQDIDLHGQSYTSQAPIVLSGQSFTLQYANPFTLTNNYLSLNLDSSLSIQGNALSLNAASENTLGGVNAQTVSINTAFMLSSHELPIYNVYTERSRFNDEDRSQQDFIGAQCVLVNNTSSESNDKTLYADLSTMVLSAVPEGDVIKVYIAAENGNGISKGEMFVKNPVLQVDNSNDEKQLYIYKDFSSSDEAPEFLSPSDLAEYNQMVAAAQGCSNLIELNLTKVYSGTFENVSNIMVNPISKDTAQNTKQIIFTTTSHGTTLTTYGNACVYVSNLDIESKSLRAVLLNNGTYALSSTYASNPAKTVITIEKYQTFNEILNS